MSNIDYLLARFPALGERLPRMRIGNLPTPVREVEVQLDSGKRQLSIKCDDLTGIVYGGNKVRKLEYIFPRARATGNAGAWRLSVQLDQIPRWRRHCTPARPGSSAHAS